MCPGACPPQVRGPNQSKTNFRFQEKNSNLDLQITSLALFHFKYPGPIEGTGLNLSLEDNAKQGVVVCDTICHHLTGELTSSLFISMF